MRGTAVTHRAVETLRRKFWLLPAIGLAGGVALAYLTTEIDRHLDVDLGLFGFSGAESARNALSSIASATLSVAGISFSVTLVALQLASSQLSPRVLTTFREDRLTQATLAAFLGTFAYALVLLGRLQETDRLPEISLSISMLAAIGALGLFVAFVGRTVAGLQASTVIRRILTDGGRAVRSAHPTGIGEPAGPAAVAAAQRAREGRRAVPLRAHGPGYLLHVDGDALLRAAARHDAVIVQDALLGDLLARRQVVAQAHFAGEPVEGAVEELEAAFTFGEERTMAGDVGFPVRALADVALRALSPSLNDPTTAENALGAITDTILAWSERDPVHLVRAAEDGTARFLARAPSLDDLVVLGFEQARLMVVDEHPLVARRMIVWLELIAERGTGAGHDVAETRRQVRLLRSTGG